VEKFLRSGKLVSTELQKTAARIVNPILSGRDLNGEYMCYGIGLLFAGNTLENWQAACLKFITGIPYTKWQVPNAGLTVLRVMKF
jgi:hypothetical protein